MKSLVFDIVGVAAFQKTMAKKRDRLQQRKKVNAAALAVVDRWIQKNFEEEGKQAVPEGWKPLHPLTIKARRKGTNKGRVGQVRILQDMGHLKGRWKHLITEKEAKIQSGVSYGLVHHKGSRKKNIPRRPIIPTQKQAAPLIKKVFDHFLKEVLK